MKIGEVCLLTKDVRRLASFYKQMLGVENNSDDEGHQFILTEETSLTGCYDGTAGNNQNRNICLAFTVDDIEREYERVQCIGAPTTSVKRTSVIFNWLGAEHRLNEQFTTFSIAESFLWFFACDMP